MAKMVTEIHAGQCFFIPDLDAAERFLLDNLAPNQVVLVLSAGDADQLNRRLFQSLDGSPEKAG